MAVAADDGFSGLRDAHLRSDDVHNALVGALQVVELYAEVGTVADQSLNLHTRCIISQRQRPLINGHFPIGSRNAVVHGGIGQICAPDRTSIGAETFEGLWGRDLVYQMSIDIYDRHTVRLFPDRVLFPNLVVHGFWH